MNGRDSQTIEQRGSPLLDWRLTLLANFRRREIIRILINHHHNRISFLDLTTILVERSDGEFPIDHDRIILDLHHRQLPVLKEAGLIEYDHTGMIHYIGDKKIENLVEEGDAGPDDNYAVLSGGDDETPENFGHQRSID